MPTNTISGPAPSQFHRKRLFQEAFDTYAPDASSKSNRLRRSLRLKQRNTGLIRGQLKQRSTIKTSAKKRKTQHTTATITKPKYKDWVEYWVNEDATLPSEDYFPNCTMVGAESLKRSNSQSSATTRAQVERLEAHNVHMNDELEMSTAGRALCDKLLKGDREPACFPSYRAEHRRLVLRRAAKANEAEIQRDITPTIVPSIQNLTMIKPNDFPEEELKHYGDELTAEWRRANPMGGKHPKPDYVAGLRRSFLPSETWDVLEKGATPDAPVWLTPDMCFPLVIVEVKKGDVGIQQATLQSTQAAAIAIKSQFQLYWKAYGKDDARLEKLYAYPLVFTVCHNHDEAHIYAHYASLKEGVLQHYQVKLAIYSQTMHNGRDQNRPNGFFENVYKQCGPLHVQRLRKAAQKIREQEEAKKAAEAEARSQASTGISFNASQMQLNDSVVNEQPESSGFKKPELPGSARRLAELESELEGARQREKEYRDTISRLGGKSKKAK